MLLFVTLSTQAQEVKNKNKHNPLAIISMNPNMFKGDETQRVKQKYEQINQQYR